MRTLRVKLNLITDGDIKKLYDAATTVSCDVRLSGRDENGNDWSLSAKSFLCIVYLTNGRQRGIDWNSIWCESEQDISHMILDLIE